jgi:hypothetical protein
MRQLIKLMLIIIFIINNGINTSYLSNININKSYKIHSYNFINNIDLNLYTNILALPSIKSKDKYSIEQEFKNILLLNIEKGKIKKEIEYFNSLFESSIKNKKKKNTSIDYIKYLKYKEDHYINFNNQAKSFTTKLSKQRKFKKTNVSKDDKKRIMQEVESQPLEKHYEIIAFIKERLDHEEKDFYFEMGLKQLFCNLEKGDVIEIISKRRISNKCVKLTILFEKGKIKIKDEIIYTKKEDYKGTRIKVIKGNKIDKEYIKKYLRNKLRYLNDERVGVYIYDEDLDEIKKINESRNLKTVTKGRKIGENTKKRSEKKIYILLNSNGYEIINEKIELKRENIFDMLLFENGFKEQSKKKKKYKLKYLVENEENNEKNKGKLALTINGITAEDYEIQGYNICDELALELSDKSIEYSIDKIIKYGQFFEILKNYIHWLNLTKKIKVEHKIKIYNTIIELLNQDKGWDEYEIRLLKRKMRKNIKKMKIPFKRLIPVFKDIEILKLDVPEDQIIYVNKDLYSGNSLDRLKEFGLKKVEEFRSERGYKLYTANFKIKDKVSIEIGNIIIINREIYENNDLDFLNLYFNYWIGYGHKSKIKGILISNKIRDDNDLKKQESKENKQKKENYEGLIDYNKIDLLLTDTKNKLIEIIKDYISVKNKDENMDYKKVREEIYNFLNQFLFLLKLNDNISVDMILDNLNVFNGETKLSYKEVEQEYFKRWDRHHFRDRDMEISLQDQNDKYESERLLAVGGKFWEIGKQNRKYYILKEGERILGEQNGFDSMEQLIVRDNDLWIICRKYNMYYLLKNGEIIKQSSKKIEFFETNKLNLKVLKFEKNNKEEHGDLKIIMKKYEKNKNLLENIVAYCLHDKDELFFEYEFMQEGLEYIGANQYNKILGYLEKIDLSYEDLEKMFAILQKKTKLEKEAYYRFLFTLVLKIEENCNENKEEVFSQYFYKLKYFMEVMVKEDVLQILLEKGLAHYLFVDFRYIPEKLLEYVKFFKEKEVDYIGEKLDIDYSFVEDKLYELQKYEKKYKKYFEKVKNRKRHEYGKKLKTLEIVEIVARENMKFYNEKGKSVHEFKFKNLGINKKMLFSKFLGVNVINKDRKVEIRKLDPKFYYLFKYHDRVEIETEKNGNNVKVILELEKDFSGKIQYVTMRTVMKKISRGKKRGYLTIRLISKDRETTVEEDVERNNYVLKMAGATLMKERKVWEKIIEKSDLESEKEEIIKIGNYIIPSDKERVLISKMPEGLKIYLNPVPISGFEQNNMYVSELTEDWFEYVPVLVKKSLEMYMDRLVIKLPKKIKINLNKNIFSYKEKKYIKKEIAIGLMKGLLNLYRNEGLEIIGLREKDFYSKKNISNKVKKDAGKINDNDSKNFDFEKYKENKEMTIELLLMLISVKDKKSLIDLWDEVAEYNKKFGKVFRSNLKNREKIIELKNKNKNKYKKILRIENSKVLQSVNWFLLSFKELTGLGFEYIEFYEADDMIRAACGLYEKDKYILRLNNRYLEKDFKIIHEAFENDKNINEIIFKLSRGSFFETLIHELAHKEEFEKNSIKEIDNSTQWTHGVDDKDNESFSSIMKQVIEKILLAKIGHSNRIVLYGKMISRFESLVLKKDFKVVINMIFSKMKNIFIKDEIYEEELKNYGLDRLEKILEAA